MAHIICSQCNAYTLLSVDVVVNNRCLVLIYSVQQGNVWRDVNGIAPIVLLELFLIFELSAAMLVLGNGDGPGINCAHTDKREPE